MFKEIKAALTDVVVTSCNLVSGSCRAIDPLVSAVTHCTKAADIYAAEIELDASFDAEKSADKRSIERKAFLSLSEED